MDILRCPVCAAALHGQDRSFKCENGHSFDLSKEGYVNLLTGEKGQHGDNKLMLSARRLFLEKGYYAPLKEAVCEALRTVMPERGRLLDEGCGEGYYTQGMANALPQAEIFGFDISKEAVRMAAKRKCGFFFVGSTYSVPIASQSVDAVTLLFSPFCREEILRVLKDDGIFVMAVPGEMHLWELKTALYETPYRNEVQDTQIEGFTLLKKTEINDRITVETQEEIAALFSMTPYYYKTSREGHERLAKLSRLETAISFTLLVYRKQ